MSILRNFTFLLTSITGGAAVELFSHKLIRNTEKGDVQEISQYFMINNNNQVELLYP